MKLFLISVLGVLLAAASGFAQSVDGEKLERDLWAQIKAGKTAEVAGKIATGFQSAHQDGARNREAEIKLLEGLNLSDYSLSNIIVTRNGPALIVTYDATVAQTIAGKRLPKRTAPRLSVWLKTERGWQWISHVNLNPMKE